MPENTLNPYNIAEEDTAGRLQALGVLTPYQPPAPPPIAAYGFEPSQMQAQAPEQMGPVAPTWDAYKAANNFDATDYTAKQQIWNNYRDKVIGDIAAAHGEDPGTLRTFFEQQYAGDKPKAPTRSVLQAANDTMISAGNAIFGSAKAVSDLVSPTSAVSDWLGQRIKEGHEEYSPLIQDEEKRRDREIAQAKALGDSGIPQSLSYYARNPLQAAAEVAGMIAPFVATGGITGATGLGARGALAANTALGGAMGAGQVRGGIWDRISAIPDDQLKAESPQYAAMRQTMNEQDAKQAVGTAFIKNLPEIGSAGALNAVGTRFGPVERALAGAPTALGRGASAAVEAAWQGAQGAGTQVATNAGLRGVLPGQSLGENVGQAAATGALFGAATGAAFGGHQPPAQTPDVALPPTQTADPLALPAPTYRLGAPDAPQSFTMEGSPYNATPADVQAILDGLPKIVNREYIGNHLASDLRNGTLEQTAQQQNSLGRAAQRLLSRLQERAQPRQLEAPDETPALPAPDMVEAGSDLVVDPSGNVRPQTYQQAADARAARQSAVDAGLTTDVRAAQDARLNPRAIGEDAPEVPSDAADATAQQGDAAGGRPVVLQNRDRSSTAAIAQMNSIAADPDPARLSFSRDFVNGAPVVEANPAVNIPASQLGRQDYAVAADGRRIPVQYAVVDADTLLPSNRADGTPVAGYADGMPGQLRAIAGNGRAAALQAAYERGSAASYRQGIGHDAALTGVSSGVIARIPRPVLVRVMPRDQVTADIGDLSNMAGTAALSPVEQAANDAHRIDFEGLQFTDTGDPLPQSVREFIQTMPVSEQVGLLNPDGTPTRQAIDRMMAATFQKAYADPELVRLYAQATDPEARTVLGGMAEAAGAMARLDGAGDLDVRPLVTEAARAAVNARRQGAKLNEFARQTDLALHPQAREFIQLFADNTRSAKRIGEALKRVADFAYSESVKPTEDMFGAVKRATRDQVLREVNSDTRRAQDLGLAAGREPATTSDARQGANPAGRADSRSAEEVGTTRSDQVAKQPAGGERSGKAVAERAAPKRIKERVAERRRAKDAIEPADEPLLTNPTPETLRQRVERQRAAKAEQARTERSVDERAIADAQRADFRLTGSDRDADVAAANGQETLLSQRGEPPPAGRNEADKAPPREGLSVSGRRLSSDHVRQAIARDIYGHDIDVYDTLADAPEYVRRQAEQEGAHDVEGFFDPRTNRVALIAENLAGAERAREVARHELIGHYGLENMVGRDTMRALTGRVIAAEKLGNKVFREVGEEVDHTQPGLSAQRRAKEMIALMAERNMQNNVARRVIDAVRQFLKKVGLMRGDVTDADVARLLRDAQAYLRAQGRPSFASGAATAAFTRQGHGGAASTFGQRADLFEHADVPMTRLAGDELASPSQIGALRLRAREAVRAFAQAPDSERTNNDTGWTFSVGRQDWKKILQPTQSTSALQATAGMKDLVRNAILAETHPDTGHSNPDVKAIHRLYAPVEISGVPYRAKLTVRDYEFSGGAAARKTLHALETVELERADGVRIGSDAADRQSQPSESAAGDIPTSEPHVRTGQPTTADSVSIADLMRGALRDADGQPFSAGGETAFSRAGSRQSAAPQVERKATFLENMRAMSRNPTPTKNAARSFLSEGGSAPQPKWLEAVTTSLFDHLNPLEQVIRRAGNTESGRALRNTMRLFQGATEKTRQDFERQNVTPAMKALRDAYKRDFAKLDWYASRPGDEGHQQFLMDIGTIGNLVKHGRERNAQIARKTEGRDTAGSGRTNEQIDAIERDIRRDAPGLVEFYEKFYQDHLKPMLDYGDRTLRDAGLLTPEMEAGRPEYKWYVPLKGDPNATEGEFSGAGGGGLKAPKEKQAMGRSGTLADNVLQNVFEAGDSAIRRAGWQQLKRDFVKFLKESPGAKVLLGAKVNEAPNQFEIFEKYVGPDGIVHQRVKPGAAMSPDALVLREGSHTTIVHIGNRKVLDALQSANRAQIDGVFSLPLKATRVLSSVYTRYNPMFPAMNKLRDVQSMMSFAMADAPTADKIGAVRRAIANNVVFTADWRMKPGGEFHKWAERYEELGGSTLYQDLFRDDTMKNLENEFGKLVGATTKYKAKAAAEKVGDFVDRVNEHMEISSRVALFKALVESGVAEKDAALYVKNTMNFETKGKLGQQLGAIYTFAGPALFDARRMAQALRTPRGAAVMLAHYALMYSLYGALKSMGGQDDDGVDKLNKVPLSQSGRFLTMIDPGDPDGRGFKFPVGFGYGRIGLTLAAATHRYVDGVDDLGTFAGNVAKDGLLSNFSPVDPTDVDPSKDMAGWVMQQFMPSIMKPLLQLALNQTGQGSPIHKPDEWTGNKLKFQQAWPQTSGLFRSAAQQLYDSTGVDVYPETISHLLRGYGGGGALDAIKAFEALGEKAETDKTLTDIPLARTFGSGPLRQDMIEFRERSTETDRLVNERKYAQEQGTLDQFDEAHPNVERVAAMFKAANGEIKALYKERNDALADEDPARRQERAQEVNRRIRVIQMGVNRAYRELRAQ